MGSTQRSDNTPRVQATPRGQEPAMYLQRPSTGRSQDVRHILARAFRDLYTRETVRPEVVKNLQVSKGGDDPYHEYYVDNLQKVRIRALFCTRKSMIDVVRMFGLSLILKNLLVHYA